MKTRNDYTNKQDSKAQTIFWVLHIFAALFGFFGLFITIPLHLIHNKKQAAL